MGFSETASEPVCPAVKSVPARLPRAAGPENSGGDHAPGNRKAIERKTDMFGEIETCSICGRSVSATGAYNMPLHGLCPCLLMRDPPTRRRHHHFPPNAPGYYR